MKVLLVNGSPHKNGCTNVALEEIAKTLTEEGIESENLSYWCKTCACMYGVLCVS